MKRSYIKRKPKKPSERKYGGLWTKRTYNVKSTYERRLKKILDTEMQRFYIPLFPTCLICPNPTGEMHHFIQKSQSTFLRWDSRNLVNLCSSCHLKHHQAGDPEIVRQIIAIKGEDWADEMTLIKNTYFKPTIEWMEEKLQELQDD